jgi:hypothetical protein
MGSQSERQERARQEKLKDIAEQVDKGELVIRPMTAEERKANPPQPRSERSSRRRRS